MSSVARMKKSEAVVLALSLLAIVSPLLKSVDAKGTGKCVWYGVCGKNPDHKGDDLNSYCLNCLAEGQEPKEMENEEARKLLMEVCPHFEKELGSSNPKVCCDYDMVKEMAKGYESAKALFGTCPTCYYNFVKNFCATTCSPHQEDFVEVNKIYEGNKTSCGGSDPGPGKKEKICLLNVEGSR